MKAIAICGGIGSGKSVVCRILSSLGYPVYDCDSRAKLIMDHDMSIKEAIRRDITPQALDDKGNLNRKKISQEVFSDTMKLKKLNQIVHGAVREDIDKWLSEQHTEKAFIETAILYESGIDKIVDEVWEVEAPEAIRIGRVCLRNNMAESEVRARINAQRTSGHTPHPHIYTIINDDCESLLLQINRLLGASNPQEEI